MKRLDVVEAVVDCEACPRSKVTMPVPIAGTEGADYLVVGGYPSADDAEVAKPFTGEAGDLLRDTLADVGLDELRPAFMSVVACAGDGPTPEHVEACAPTRELQANLAGARWTLLVGALPLRTYAPALRTVHGLGRPFLIDGIVHFGTFNPSQAMADPSVLRQFRSHLETFAEMLTEEKEWTLHGGDDCSVCDAWFEWITDDGLTWCGDHVPAYGRQAYEERVALLEEHRDVLALEWQTEDDEGWTRRAWETLTGYLRTHDEFFVDSFWAETGLEVPREARALGPLVRRAAMAGQMEKTGEFRKSDASNRSEKPVWRSLIGPMVAAHG